MCGIAGVILRNSIAGEILTRMLTNLEYRGYDSCGIAIIKSGYIEIRKDVRREKESIKSVCERNKFHEMQGYVGIAHTRWATHGGVTSYNAHPHTDCQNTIAVVHNGIIQNYAELREWLKRRGHVFKSETDTETVPHLIEEFLKETNDFYQAFKKAIRMLKGTYALGVITIHEPDKIFFARYRSPLLIGVGDNELFLASDVLAFLDWTRRYIELNDGDIGYISVTGEIFIENFISNTIVKPVITETSWTKEAAMKGGYPHYMLKEIFEQPRAVRETLIKASENISEFVNELEKANTIYLTAAGTSYHACLCAQYAFAQYGLRTHAIIASEFREVACVDEDTIIVAVSQSGETMDVLQAIRWAKEKGAKILAITNRIGSSLMREAHLTVIMGAGPEIGVAATKTFLSQVAVLSLAIIEYAKRRGYDIDDIAQKLNESPEHIEQVVKKADEWAKSLSEEMKEKTNAFFIGRGIGLPIALEGALKLKEISYIHAEGYPAGESKHGPIALIEPGFPVIAVLLNDKLHELVVSNIHELKARGAWTIIIAEEGDEDAKRYGDRVFYVPKGFSNILAPLVYEPPLQLLAYWTAVKRGCDPDRPRNLAKSVTVE